MSEEAGERAEALCEGVIGPLLLGGTLRLQRPFGARLALAIGPHRRVVDDELRSMIDLARLRVARAIVAVDVLPELDAAEWALACALNDLLQATNHELSSFATRGRHAELLDAIDQTTAAVGPPRTLAQAVARHATFSRAPRVVRVDQTVSWWTGSQAFRGQEPPARLLAWPEMRRVRVHKVEIRLAEMAPGSALDEEAYLGSMARWLACTPLTDIATAGRAAPVFRWSAATLGLVATVPGANLALRAFEATSGDGGAQGVAHLAAAVEGLAAHSVPHKVAATFVQDLQRARAA